MTRHEIGFDRIEFILCSYRNVDNIQILEQADTK